MAKRKMVYLFEEGSAEMRNLLGGKGAGLAEMTRLGLPVPPGFTITTAVCNSYYKLNKNFPSGLRQRVREALHSVEEKMQRKFGGTERPLLVSVRSGARVSMPGMMDTVLNLGLNDSTVSSIINETGDPRWGFDTYRRFVQMYGNVVMGVEHSVFEEILSESKRVRGIKLDTELNEEELSVLVGRYKEKIRELTGREFPEDPFDQLWNAIGAVFESWNNRRAITYRQLNNIPEEWGTAVTVQSMVFGNMGEDCATGVAFTRNPATGENRLYGEYLPNAQGEDVVAGIRTPQPINRDPSKPGLSLEEKMPDTHSELLRVKDLLESHYKDMQDIEFTIQKGKLFLLQTRSGKRTAQAAVRVAVEMANEGLISREDAILSVDPSVLDQLLHPVFDENAERRPIGRGLPASPGAASGRVVFDAAEAVKLASGGEKVILVRNETSAEDIHGMAAAQAILTATGGMTSHAAVVARGMGKCCVVGCSDISISQGSKSFTASDGVVVSEGEYISVDGTSGNVYLGQLPTKAAELTGFFETFMEWADSFKRLGIRANADLPEDARIARKFGAKGIGLTRTEHMFFGEHRLPHMRRMILANTTEKRKEALESLLPYQREDFMGLFREMNGYPVIIRLLDPPLHEFLPKGRDEVERLAHEMGISTEEIVSRTEALRELNPMLGHRGCRLAITYPEVYEMQYRAIFEAACELKRKENIDVVPEIMIPLVEGREEIDILRPQIDRTAEEVMGRYGMKMNYLVGTMIELPRAAILSDSIAPAVDFFSYGTNDLTQTVLGLSRDDAGRFLPEYVQMKIFPFDPFMTIDVKGVGSLVRSSAIRGKKANGKLEVGICGEHGGDPKSIEFFHSAGLDYVSCSPYRVPIARLAAAQAAIRAARTERKPRPGKDQD
ncbi:MAG: pyruvate, phosphate dikinase [Thermoplasmata archaeon]|uniref:pyruvate, phosphate dikinase n=1 Tax=Candidatus Sysuiplasma superficiale TaxID=2823368 RepID=A0A8J8CC80_9ARCH|nr:pyruvate, phosphate dikinase [Candidatus Sysuiplasma superficiale]